MKKTEILPKDIHSKFIDDWYLIFDLCLEYVNNLENGTCPTIFLEDIIAEKGLFIKKNYKNLGKILFHEMYSLSLLFTYMVRINAEYGIDDLQGPLCHDHDNIFGYIYEKFGKIADFEIIAEIIDLFIVNLDADNIPISDILFGVSKNKKILKTPEYKDYFLCVIKEINSFDSNYFEEEFFQKLYNAFGGDTQDTNNPI